MGRGWQGIRERPPEFDLNPQASLARGLGLAGLARFTRSTRYHDSSLYGSLYGNHGTLTNYTGAGDTPADMWQWDNYLGRWVLGFAAANPANYVAMSFPFSYPTNTFTCWINLTDSDTNGSIPWGTATTNACYWQLQSTTLVVVQTASCTVTSTNFWNSTWMHLAFLNYGNAAGTKKEVWCNGVLIGTTTNAATALASGTLAWRLGAWTSNTDWRCRGKLADPCFYGRVLSASEISALADPSNVMLSGLILPLRRRLWAVKAPVAYSQTIDDGMGITDIDTRMAAYFRTQSDPLGLADAALRVSEHNRTVADNEGITDATTRIVALIRDLADVLGATDVTTRTEGHNRVITDSEDLTDIVTRIAGIIRDLAESLEITDSVLDDLVIGFKAAWHIIMRRNRT